LVENCRFQRIQPTPPVFGAPLMVTLWEFRWGLWQKKSRVPGLSCSIIFAILSHLGTIPVCDTRMDRQTHDDIPR